MDKPVIIANWKMNGSIDLINNIISALELKQAEQKNNSEIVICPPNIYISIFKHKIKNLNNSNLNIKLGSQNIYQEEDGAFTGETSARMLQEIGVDYVILGHSERRKYFQESDQEIAKKCLMANKYNLKIILCIGESKEDRENNKTFDIINNQLDNIIKITGMSLFNNIIIAYEPVWAIGTGLTASSAQAQEVHNFIRKKIAVSTKIVYGGSANAKNALDLLNQKDIDGLLVGGASLKATEFANMCSLKVTN